MDSLQLFLTCHSSREHPDSGRSFRRNCPKLPTPCRWPSPKRLVSILASRTRSNLWQSKLGGQAVEIEAGASACLQCGTEHQICLRPSTWRSTTCTTTSTSTLTCRQCRSRRQRQYQCGRCAGLRRELGRSFENNPTINPSTITCWSLQDRFVGGVQLHQETKLPHANFWVQENCSYLRFAYFSPRKLHKLHLHTMTVLFWQVLPFGEEINRCCFRRTGHSYSRQ